LAHDTARWQFSSYFLVTFQQRSFNFIVTTSELLLFALGPFLFSNYDCSCYCPKWQAASSHLLLLQRKSTTITHQLVTYPPSLSLWHQIRVKNSTYHCTMVKLFL